MYKASLLIYRYTSIFIRIYYIYDDYTQYNINKIHPHWLHLPRFPYIHLFDSYYVDSIAIFQLHLRVCKVLLVFKSIDYIYCNVSQTSYLCILKLIGQIKGDIVQVRTIFRLCLYHIFTSYGICSFFTFQCILSHANFDSSLNYWLGIFDRPGHEY